MLSLRSIKSLSWQQIKDMLTRATHTRLMITVWRVVMLYMALTICHISFYLYNQDLVGDISINEAWPLFKGMMRFDGVSASYTLLLFFIFAILPFSERIWNSKWYRWTMFACYIIPVGMTLAINMGDVVYFHYVQKRCTTDEIFFADNSNTLHLMLEFMWENKLLVLIYLLMMALIVWGYRIKFRTKDIVHLPKRNQYSNIDKEQTEHDKKIFKHKYIKSMCSLVSLRIFFTLLVAYYAFGGIRGNYTSIDRPITLTNAMYYTMSPGKAIMILSNPFCIIQTISGNIDVPQYFDAEEVDRLCNTTHYPEDYHSEMFGRYKGYNVVIFILEGFSAEHSAYLLPELHNSEGYTPNLDAIMRNGLTFTQCYANGVASRAAPPAIWSSIPSFGDKIFMLRPQSMAECHTLPYILGNSGYATSFFCGSESDSMGFGSYAHVAGINKLYCMDDYVAVHSNKDYDNYWGIWDEPFMQYMGEELSNQQEPFFASIFTITSHHPYNVPPHLANKLPRGTTRAHQSVAYTDYAIGRFMDRYRNEPWFNNTIFVFVADHVASERMASRTKTFPGLNHIICCFYTPDGSLRQRYDHTISQLEIMPTLLGLLGNDEPYFAFGRDIFNEPDREIFEVIPYNFSVMGMTDEYYVEFANDNIVGVYSRSDYEHENDLSASFDAGHIDTLIRAYMQQYFTRVKNMDYLPDERE